MDYRYRVVFAVEYPAGEVDVDAFHVFDMEDVVARQAKERILGTADPELVTLATTYEGMGFRSRYTAGGQLFIFQTEGPMTREELQDLLTAWQQDGQLRDQLRKAG